MCAEHKKPAKLLKHLAAIKAAAEGLRNPPRVLVFANRIKVHPRAAFVWDRKRGRGATRGAEQAWASQKQLCMRVHHTRV